MTVGRTDRPRARRPGDVRLMAHGHSAGLNVGQSEPGVAIRSMSDLRARCATGGSRRMKLSDAVARRATGQMPFIVRRQGRAKVRSDQRPNDWHPRPIWFCVWGGPADLAQAIWKVRATRSPAELERFLSKLRVYLIIKQDGSAQWLLDQFPRLFDHPHRAELLRHVLELDPAPINNSRTSPGSMPTSAPATARWEPPIPKAARIRKPRE